MRRLTAGKPTLQPPYELLFAAYKTGGADALVRRYHELRAKGSDKYLWEVRTTTNVGVAGVARFARRPGAEREAWRGLTCARHWLSRIWISSAKITRPRCLLQFD